MTKKTVPQAHTPFQRCLYHLLSIEGGYSDRAADRGGKTRFGITEAVARSHGYPGAIKALPLDTAEIIYKKSYWNKLCLDQVNDREIAYKLFDAAVNVGPGRVARWLQEDLNVLNQNKKYWTELTEDGKVGSGTIAVLSKALGRPKIKSRLLKLLNADQASHYKMLSRKMFDQRLNLGGWLDQRITFPS